LIDRRPDSDCANRRMTEFDMTLPFIRSILALFGVIHKNSRDHSRFWRAASMASIACGSCGLEASVAN
jgi:hypothetical protein